jgi:hypothetical protein
MLRRYQPVMTELSFSGRFFPPVELSKVPSEFVLVGSFETP